MSELKQNDAGEWRYETLHHMGRRCRGWDYRDPAIYVITLVAFATPAYEAKREALLALARKGQVLISPCVSDGERQIAREALAAGYRLITLQNKGFSRLQKPAGRYFDACTEGRLLMLAPGAWPYQPGEKPMTRLDATAMNRLCQYLAGPGAAEVNYHGLKPSNVDKIAQESIAFCAIS